MSRYVPLEIKADVVLKLVEGFLRGPNYDAKDQDLFTELQVAANADSAKGGVDVAVWRLARGMNTIEFGRFFVRADVFEGEDIVSYCKNRTREVVNEIIEYEIDQEIKAQEIAT